jgi:hypothetical protein
MDVLINSYSGSHIEIHFHRRGAKNAEYDYFLFSVDPPKGPADRKDGK